MMTIEIRRQPAQMAAKIVCGHWVPNYLAPNCRKGYPALLSSILEIPMAFVSRSGRRVA